MTPSQNATRFSESVTRILRWKIPGPWVPTVYLWFQVKLSTRASRFWLLRLQLNPIATFTASRLAPVTVAVFHSPFLPDRISSPPVKDTPSPPGSAFPLMSHQISKARPVSLFSDDAPCWNRHWPVIGVPGVYGNRTDSMFEMPRKFWNTAEKVPVSAPPASIDHPLPSIHCPLSPSSKSPLGTELLSSAASSKASHLTTTSFVMLSTRTAAPGGRFASTISTVQRPMLLLICNRPS